MDCSLVIQGEFSCHVHDGVKCSTRRFLLPLSLREKIDVLVSLALISFDTKRIQDFYSPAWSFPHAGCPVSWCTRIQHEYIA